jgi:hypothetical protein
MPCLDFVAITAAYNREPYLALMPVTATAGQFAAGNMSVGLGPIEEKIQALHAMKHALAKLVEECSGQGEITDCPILAALDTEGKVHN